MRKLLPLVLLLLALSCMAAADTVTMTLVSVGPANYGGVYVYPYNFSINGSSTLTPLICDSYDNDVYVGETWTATVTSLTDYLGMLTPVSGSKETAYQEAAWLLSQINSSNAVAVNYAIWGLFSTSIPNSTYASSGAAGWLSQAVQGINDPNFQSSLGNYVVYTPTGAPQGYGLPQEYIGLAPPTVPEPASLLMLGTGILGLIGVRKRRVV